VRLCRLLINSYEPMNGDSFYVVMPRVTTGLLRFLRRARVLTGGQGGPMQVLLTGGAGFIGRAVWRELLDRGYEVRVLDSLRPDVHRDRSPEFVAGLPSDDLVIGDVRDAAVVDDALSGVDAVCHLAAKVGLGVDGQDLPDYASSNDYGTAVLLAAMERAGIQRLVLASSMVVYGEGLGECAVHGLVRPAQRSEDDLRSGRFESPCPLCGSPLGPVLVGEDARLDPRNAYAATKLAQENLASAWARATGGTVAAMRYHNVYGPGMPRSTPYAGVAAIFVSSLLCGQAPQVFEDGRQRRDFIHVSDVAAATVAALDASDYQARAYNVGSGQPRTIGEVAEALTTALGATPPVITGAYRLGDIRHMTADSSRARTELGWQPNVGFVDGIAQLTSSQPAP
jgi:dTDP-L-rhamnose 4-epimerase